MMILKQVFTTPDRGKGASKKEHGHITMKRTKDTKVSDNSSCYLRALRVLRGESNHLHALNLEHDPLRIFDDVFDAL